MKKLSTLVAGLLLATSFGASAQMTGGAQSSVENGEQYFLYRATTDYTGFLGMSGDTLKIFENDDILKASKVDRAKALWSISYSTPMNASNLIWEFVNDSTKKNLMADSQKQFAWVTDAANASTGTSLTWTDSDGKSYILAPCFVTQKSEEGSTATLSKYSELAVDENGYSTLRIFEVDNDRADNYDPDKLTFSSSVAAAQVAAAKALVVRVDAKLKELGYSRYQTELADYNTFATSVENELAEGDNSASRDYNTVKSNAATAVKNYLVGNKYGFCYLTKDGWAGVVAAATNSSNDLLENGKKYAKGLVAVSEDLLTFQPYTLNAKNFTENEPTMSSEAEGNVQITAFRKEFKLASEQTDSLITIGIDLTGKDVPAITGTNPFASAQIQLVGKNILIDNTTGVSVKKAASGALATNDFKPHWMIYDRNTKKYLYVSSETYNDDPTVGRNFKLEWVSLKDLSAYVGSAAAGITYNNVVGKDHVGSAAFLVNYDPMTGQIDIAPEFLYQKKTADAKADTTGAAYAITKQSSFGSEVLGLKKFGSTVELTVVDKNGTDPIYKMYVGASKDAPGWTKATIANDVNFIQYVSADNKNKDYNGLYLTSATTDKKTLVKAESSELNINPEMQWAVTIKDGKTTIVNRETNKELTFESKSYKNVTLYKGSALKASDTYVTLMNGDTLKFTSVDTKYKMDSTLGHFAYDSALAVVSGTEKFKLTYYNSLDSTLCLNINKDSVLYVDKNGGHVMLKVAKTANATKYADGVKDADGKEIAKPLYKTTYNLFAVIDGKEYAVGVKDGKYAINYDADDAKFDIKEKSHQASCWYVLNDVAGSTTYQASVDDRTLELFKEALTENRTSLFAIAGENYAYRNIGKDTTYVEFYMAKEPTRFLYENSQNRVANNGTKVAADSLCFLGVYNKADLTRNASVFVDTAYVRNDTIKPLYMLAVDAVYTPDTTVEQVCTVHKVKDGHGTKVTEKANITGRYLVSLADSTENASAKFEGATRLAFVPATHVGDSLIIASSKYAAKAATAGKDTLDLAKVGTMNAATFAFELVDSQDADGDFYMQNGAGYVRIENGVPVMTSDKAKAATFNIKKSEVVPTANETVAAEGVKVIAGEGFVTVKGAAGKKVVIANVLGQTVANTVVASDEAQIAAPAGVVIVAVDGEAAVKAIVK